MTEEEWLEMVWPSLTFVVNIDDEPVGLEPRQYFGEWLAWLLSSSNDDDLVND